MTKEEAIMDIRRRICNEGEHRDDKTYHFCDDSCRYGNDCCAIDMAVSALKKERKEE